mgnify:CR=1 FL=1
MSTAIKTKQNIGELEKEVKMLRSFVIGLAGKDPEGNYQPEFIKKIFKDLKEKPVYRFTNPSSFLTQLKRKK